jgi:peptidoglycan/xylan/chitin deacetylase (PgdA/CDA1 family)
MALSTTVRSLVSRFHSLARHLWVYALHMSGALARAKNRIRADEGAVVLTLHRVLPDRERKTTLSPPGMVMSEQTFASMVRYLAAEHRVFPLDTPQKSVRSDPRIAIALTFDDGWVDNARYAQRTLALHSMPAAVFLCPEKMGKSLPFWPERLLAFLRAATRLRREREFLVVIKEWAQLPEVKATAGPDELVEVVKQFSPRQRNLLFERLEQLGFAKNLDNSAATDSTMSWEDARRLSESGFLFGSHTLHHEILTQIPLEETYEQLIESRTRLNLEIGRRCFAFAYPNGDWSPEIRERTVSAGYAMAFANKPGVWTAQTDLFTVPRIGLWEGAITNFRGHFSKPHFEYVVFWKTLRDAQKANLPGPVVKKHELKAGLSPRAA